MENKIGLALGSGGPRGLAHIGVMKVLNENGFNVDTVSGSSIGALVGGAYAVTQSIKEVEKMAMSTDMKMVLGILFDPTIKSGLIRGEKVTKFIKKMFGDPDIKTLKTPFFPVATDFSTGKPVVFKEGSFVETVRASISIPFLFQPVLIGDRVFADGGLSMQVPVQPLKKNKANIIIAVNLAENAYNKEDFSVNGLVRSPVGLYKMAVNSIGILEINLARENCRDADIVVSPNVQNVGWDSFWKPTNVIKQGEIAMQKKLPKLIRLLNKS
jgi:NTE family protein